MSVDLQIACNCGSLRGVARGVSRQAGNRLVCYCDDCQSFADFLQCTNEILDAHGGTGVFQMSPACLEITEGSRYLACVRLTPNGVLRWYARCCKTPIGNTLPTRQIPFVSLIHSCMRVENQTLDEVIGPVRAGVNGKYAKGNRAGLNAHDKVPLPVLFRVIRKLLGWRLRGDHKHTPFFDTAGVPVATPRTVGEQDSSSKS